MNREVYLDNNATTQALPEVVDAVADAMVDGFGNPSSVHGAGARARRMVQSAREQVASILNADPKSIVFTSGATEANNLVLQSLRAGRLAGYRLVTSAVEHSAILEAAEYLRGLGQDVVVLPVGRDGLVDVETLSEAIDPGRTLVSMQWANNESGVVQPMERMLAIARERGALLHTDAVQAVGKIPIDLRSLDVDFLSLSAHKVHGPLGIGALIAKDASLLQPLTYGGSQEGAVRPGTENVPGIVGMGVALEVRAKRFNEVAEGTQQLRDRFESELASLGLVASINGSPAPRLPATSSVRFAGADGEALILRLDGLGIRCSQSSACTNQKPEPSYVLRAMGLTEDEAFSSVRFGFSELNQQDDVGAAVAAIASIHASLARFAIA
jgi:cysteine desulfurase